MHRKAAALSFFTFNHQCSTMNFSYFLAQGQPETKSTLISGSIALIKILKNFSNLVLWNTTSIVLYLNHLTIYRYDYFRCSRLLCVITEIGKEHRQKILISINYTVFINNN